MVMVVAPMLAPLAGGYLDEWFGWRSTFLAVLAVGAAVLVFTWLLLHETHHDRSGGAGPLAMLGGFGVLLRYAGFVGYAVTVSFPTAVFFAFLAGAHYVLIELMDLPSSEYGLYFMLTAVSSIAGHYHSGPPATLTGPAPNTLP